MTCYVITYIAEQQQRVLFHGDLSNWGAISIGRGSILGPLLFALYYYYNYINDLPQLSITVC